MAEVIDTREVSRDEEVTSGTLSSPSSGESSPSRPDPTAGSLPVMVEANTYRPQLVLAPEAASELVEQVKAMQRSVLVEGTDYDRIPGTGTKPTLLKPGAERLLQVFGLGHAMEVLSYDEDGDGRKTGVTYRCTVTKVLADGREITVSSCDGHASHEEPKWRKAPWNTVIKMAQKRALVGACLTATATSGLFTQDIEDFPREDRSARRSAPRREPVEHPEAGVVDNGITDAQVTKIQVLFGKLGIKDRETRLYECGIALDREVTTTKDMTKAEASKLIDYLEAQV